METIFEESPKDHIFHKTIKPKAFKITPPTNKNLQNSKRALELMNSPKRSSKKNPFLSSAKKKNSIKVSRLSENLSFKNEGFNLCKSVKKIRSKNLNKEELFHQFQEPAFASPVKKNKENSFQKLLMDSEKYPDSKYLVLNNETFDDGDNYHKYEKEKKLLKKFISFFNERNPEILLLFVTFLKKINNKIFRKEKDGFIEIMGQDCFPLKETIEAMANNFKTLQFLGDEKNYSVNSCEENDKMIILNFEGNALNYYEKEIFFYLSAKIFTIFKDTTIEQIRIKFVG